MKIKTDHVTNSSSASFIVAIDNLTDLQKFIIENHVEFCKLYHPQALEYTDIFGNSDEQYSSSGWGIATYEDRIEGETSMDNFDMFWFLKEIGLKDDDIEYYHHR